MPDFPMHDGAAAGRRAGWHLRLFVARRCREEAWPCTILALKNLARATAIAGSAPSRP